MTPKQTGAKRFALCVDAETMDAIEAWPAYKFHIIHDVMG